MQFYIIPCRGVISIGRLCHLYIVVEIYKDSIFVYIYVFILQICTTDMHCIIYDVYVFYMYVFLRALYANDTCAFVKDAYFEVTKR